MSCDRDERVCVRLQSTLVEFPVSVQWPVCNVEQIVTYTAVGPLFRPPNVLTGDLAVASACQSPLRRLVGPLRPRVRSKLLCGSVSCNGREAA